MVARGPDDDQLRPRNSRLLESLQQVIRPLAWVDREDRQHAKCVVRLGYGMKIIQVDGWKHYFDLFGRNTPFNKRLFGKIGNRLDRGSAFDFTPHATQHTGVNEARRLYAQPPMLLLQAAGDVLDVR